MVTGGTTGERKGKRGGRTRTTATPGASGKALSEKGVAARQAKALAKALRGSPDDMLEALRASICRVLDEADLDKVMKKTLDTDQRAFIDLLKMVLPKMVAAKDPPKTPEQAAVEALGEVPGELDRWVEERRRGAMIAPGPSVVPQ